ncbi:TonB-dependent receptor plug domain-containing protein, partial [Halobacillus litoralis]|nr:TonB-dependent receptor plug domain-containing protein [Halobacillus litoralis]
MLCGEAQQATGSYTMTNRQAILPLAAAISLSASVSTAQTADGITQVSSLELNPLIVTSSRMTETADEALSAVSVIDREEIEQRQPQSTFDLLQTEPGVDVARNGGRGANNSVFLRGTESDHTLVLMDGMR